MSDETYTPPDSSWRLPVFIEASLEDVKARVVDCNTCPVSLLCRAGQGGSGWVCPKCNSTGVYVDVPEPNNFPKDLINVDCQKHNFHRREEAKNLTQCSFCDGNIMELEVLAKETKNHYVATVHAAMPVEKRQAMFKERYAFWTKHYAEEAAKEKK